MKKWYNATQKKKFYFTKIFFWVLLWHFLKSAIFYQYLLYSIMLFFYKPQARVPSIGTYFVNRYAILSFSIGCLLSLLSVSLTPNLFAQNPLSSVGKFNVFTQGNATLTTNESEGPIAIGGNLTVGGNYQITTVNVGDVQVGTIPIGLIVAGGVTLSSGQLQINTNGYVKIGNCAGLTVWYKDNNNAFSPIRITKDTEGYPSPSAWIQINTSADGWTGYAQPNQVTSSNNPVCEVSPVNFTTAFTTLKANSTSLAQCQGVSIITENANGDALSSIAGQNVYLDLPSNPLAGKPRIWNVSGADLNAINEFNLRFTPTANEPLVINVSTGASFTWNVKNQNVGGAMKFIIWNFPNATTLNIEGNATVEGSILAPNAAIVKTVNQSNMQGQLVGQSFIHGGGEMHHYPFEGNVDCTTSVCVKPKAGNDTTVCITSTQLKVPASDETWAFLSSNNNTTASITTGGLVSGLTVSGQYRFVLRKQSDANCSDTIVVTKSSFLLPTISDKSICPGEILTFGFQGLTNVTYAWSTGVTTPTVTVNPIQTTNYSVTVTSLSTGCTFKDTIQVEVSPKPNAGQDTLVCGTTAKVVAAASGQSWSFLSFNDPNNSANTDVATIDAQGNIASLDKRGFYRFVLTNGSGCTDTVRVQKTTVTIPAITLNPICPGTQLTFGYTDSTNFSYAWSNGATTARITVQPSTTTDYYVTVTSLQTQCTGKDTITVTVKPAPKLTLVTSVCSQDNSKYITTVTVDNGAVVTSNAGVVSGSGTTYTVIVGSDTTQYTITATLDGCRTRLTVNKPTCTNCPTIAPPSASNVAVCVGATATLTASNCATGTAAKWYDSATLTTEIGSGVSFTTPNINQAQNYYVACVSTTNTACKSTGVTVNVTVKPIPSFSGVITNCASGNSNYSVTISSTGTVTISSPSGVTISGTGPFTISNVPAGQNLVLTSTLNGCTKDTTIIAPNCACIPITPTALAANVGICEGGTIPIPTFTALVGANTTVDWYSAATGGTLLASNTLSFSVTTAGTYYMQAKSTAVGCNNEVNAVRVPVTLAISPKPVFGLQAQDPTCQGGTALNNGNVTITSGTVGQFFAFNTAGAAALPKAASEGTEITSLPAIVAQNIANTIATTTYYVRVFSNEGCYKDTSVTVRPKICVSDCPTLTAIDASDTLCSGYYGEGMAVQVSDTAKLVRFVYFTSQQTGTSMYTGGTLIEEVKPQNFQVSIPNGLPGLQLPANTGTVPIKYYVYAILSNPPTNVANCFPFAEKVYTILPLPKFEMDSIPACTGDNTYTVNLKILSSGTFKVTVATGIASIGNGPIPIDISQTLTGVAGGGQVTSIKLQTTGGAIIFVEDANGCTSALPAPQPSFKACEGVYDLALDKSIDKKIARIGDALTYTIKVWNEGQSTATNISVKDSLNAGVEYVTYATAFGNYDFNSKTWTIGSLAPGDTAVLSLVVKVVAQGVWFNTAEICTMTENDLDSTPCNGNEEEDDIDRECFTVPLEVCTGEAVQASIPQKYQNVQWFKDGSQTAVATGNEILITEPGTYTFTASSNTCPAEGCCPIIVEPSNNCCPPDLCVPFTIKRSKKGGVPLK